MFQPKSCFQDPQHCEFYPCRHDGTGLCADCGTHACDSHSEEVGPDFEFDEGSYQNPYFTPVLCEDCQAARAREAAAFGKRITVEVVRPAFGRSEVAA